MYSYQILPDDSRVLVIRHEGIFEGAEGNQATLDVLQKLNYAELSVLSLLIRDCSSITDVSLKDTDRAGQAHYEEKLVSLFSRWNCTHVLVNARFCLLEPRDSNCRALMRDRMARTSLDVGFPGGILAIKEQTLLFADYAEAQAAYPDYNLALSSEWLTT